jgi:hypothetical protein
MVNHSLIKQGNQKIAIFMGAKLLRTEEAEMPHGSHSIVTMEYWKRPSDLPGHENYADLGHFRYDNDWGWIMPVLEKIASTGRTYSVGRSKTGAYCEIWYNDYEEVGNFAETPLTAAWLTVIDFIDILNEEND